MTTNKKILSVLDLFAGAGGFSLGFEMSKKYKIIGAIEIDEWATETFRMNHPKAKVLVKNIQSISDQELTKHFKNVDVILGGPPCQGFSICNKNAGDPKDPRNSLFMEFLRAVKVLNPKIVIMENVPNLLKAKTHNNENVIDIIKKELEKLGYNVDFTLLEAVKYGVPQIRKRLFVVGSKKKLTNPFPSPKLDEKDYLTTWEAISDLPEIDAREGSEIMEYTKEPNNKFQKAMRSNSKELYNHVAMKHSKRTVERFSAMKWGHSIKDVPENLKPYKRNGNGAISKKVYDQNNRRMHPEKPCHTIPASFYANFVHPFKDRNFTAREGARLQTFPDNYRFYGKPTVVSRKLLQREGRHGENYLCQYNQIGNAVPPLLAQCIATNIYNQIN